MQAHTLAWLIGLPFLAAPAIYFAGRVWRPKRSLQAVSPAQLVALLALAGTGLVYVQAWLSFRHQGPLAYVVGATTLRLDGLSLLLAAVALVLATLVTVYSGPAIAGQTGEEKYYAMLVAMSGTIIGLGCATDLFNLWLWFEAMAIASYLLVAFHRDEPASLEATVKYLVQSVTGSVSVLFGVALILASAGTLSLDELRSLPLAAGGDHLPLLAAGALFVAGFGVKIALVPLHTWLPDAHAQAPSGISALLSGIVIEAGLVALLRALTGLAGTTPSWGVLLLGFGAANMLVGNLLALPQQQLKRLLAFSSVTHVGYMLLGLGFAVYGGEQAGAEGGLFHLINHGLMKALAFLAAGALLYAFETRGGTTGHTRRTLAVGDLAGAARQYPWLAAALTVALLSLGGIPPLAGFMSKWQILAAGLATGQAALILLVLFAAFNSLLSLGYYLPLVGLLYRHQESPAVRAGRPLPLTLNLSLLALAIAVILLGVWPGLASQLTEPAGAAVMAVLGR